MRKNVLQRRMVAAVTSIVAAAGMTFVAAPVASAGNGWGAIAYAPNGANGWARGFSSSGSARGAALNSCGWTSCKVLTTFTGCGAVADNGSSFQGGTGPTLGAAMSDAMTRLPGSWIDSWACN
ncbi:putative secreted protein [Mycobacteroides abscessus subsp. abscessus]|uniref:DUF4189 domain-containing protein n=1 Tax=Mycobacteroides abscessus TaxID=36809 RepID=UPI000928DED3|nr:DUF4189 domain-containing protein [Mycobacteroides abscessus]SIH34884.1 putative secreted protein [Mycobacteroides abscessus subsp. abscessus]